MKWRLLFNLLFLVCFVFTGSALAATYYVAPNGNDNNPGTLSSPWKTISKANSTLAPGDTVFIRAGTYSEQIKPVRSGTAGKYIKYSAYYIGTTPEKVTINYSAAAAPQADLEYRSYVVIDGLNFVNSMKMWVNMQYGHHITLENCTFTRALNYHGIRGWDASYCIIRNCAFTAGPDSIAEPGTHGTPADMVSMYRAHHNLIENNVFNKSTHASVVIAYAGSTYNVVRNNIVNNEWHMGVGVTTLANNERNLVEGNIIKNSGELCLENPQDSESCRPGSRFSRINQVSINVYNAINTIVRKNTFYKNGSFNLGGAPDRVASDNKIYNNTFDQEHQAIRHMGGSTHAGWYNNIYKNNAISRSIDRSIYAVPDINHRTRDINFLINNNFFNGTVTALYKGATAQDDLAKIISAWSNEFSGNVSANPKFTNWNNRDYTLRPDSPLIDSGSWLTTITSTSGTGNSFRVADAGYFSDGWGIVEGDRIQIQNSSNPVNIIAIDYSTNVITIDTRITWKNGDGVSLPYSGKAPDIGAHEHTGQVTRLNPPSALILKTGS